MQAIGLQLLLIVIRAILAAAIRVEQAAWRRVAEAYSHVQRPDRQILLHPVAGRPPNNAATVQVEYDRKVEPTLRSPDIGYIAGPFAVECSSHKIPIQPVGGNTQTVIAVRRHLMPTRTNRLDPVPLGAQ